MGRVILHSHIADHHELVDPDSDFGKYISQNDGILVPPSWYCPLLIYTLLFPTLNRLEYIANVDGGIRDQIYPVLLLEACGCDGPQVSIR